jgi:hypothetical protein
VIPGTASAQGPIRWFVICLVWAIGSALLGAPLWGALAIGLVLAGLDAIACEVAAHR